MFHKNQVRKIFEFLHSGDLKLIEKPRKLSLVKKPEKIFKKQKTDTSNDSSDIVKKPKKVDSDDELQKLLKIG